VSRLEPTDAAIVAALAQDGRCSAPDDYPQRLAHLTAIESCYSVAGEAS